MVGLKGQHLVGMMVAQMAASKVELMVVQKAYVWVEQLDMT